MSENNNKTKGPGFDTLAGELEKRNDPGSKALAAEIRSNRKKGLHLISGEADKEKIENAQKKRQFVIGLAFIDGDMQKGLKDTIGFSQSDLDRMEELEIGFSYSGDVMIGLLTSRQIIPFIMPDGKTGVLSISVDPEKGKFLYDFRKDITRAEEKKAMSGAA